MNSRRFAILSIFVLVLLASEPLTADAARYIRLSGHVVLRGNIRLAGDSPVATLGTVNISTSALAAGTLTVPYSQSISANGGLGTGFTYAVTGGALPSGLSLSSGGTLSGTPSAAGTFEFTVTATDSRGNVGFRMLSLTVSEAPTISVSPTSLTTPTYNSAYSDTVSASGGTAPYTYAVTSGALPAGLSLSSGGSLSGTPAAAGPFSFTITATDANNFTGSRAYSFTITAPSITLSPASPLAGGTAYVSYTNTITASGGASAYTFAVTSGALPAGLSLASGGGISGAPTGTGTSNFTVTATDANGYTGSQAYALTISAPTISVSPTSLTTPTYNSAYSDTVSASGGTAPYSYTVSLGSVPSGLSLNASNGAITGTPNAAGAYSFIITATDAHSFQGSRSYSGTITAPSITLSPTSFSNGAQNSAYSQSITASGGAASYTYAVTSGSVPSGMSLSSGGSLSGTPTGYGTSNFTVTATDANGYTGSRAYSLTIDQRVFAYTISSDTNKANLYTIAGSPAGGTGYTYNFTVNGGVTVYSDTTATAAMTVSGFAAGATVTITNNGSIIGMGGAGGNGSAKGVVGGAGYNGGTAIDLAISLTITNNGLIAGGGGGGGAGGASGSFGTSGTAGGGGQSYITSPGGLTSGCNGGNGTTAGGGQGGCSGGAGGANGVDGTTGGNLPYNAYGGGGGGYGASGGHGGTSTSSNVAGGAGGNGGAAVSRGGNTVTWLATGTRYGTY